MRQKIILILFTASVVMLAGCDNDNTQMVTRGMSISYESTEETSSATPSNGRKVALVIGNGAYTDDNWPKLRNAPNDAKAVAAALGNLGFTVTLKTNLMKSEMETAFDTFETEASNAAVALFFFAGHGVQSKNENFLAPIEISARSIAGITNQSTSLYYLLDALGVAKSKVNIVMLDACRDNPYGDYRGGKRGLASVSAPDNTVIVYAAEPGKISADRAGGSNNSPFTTGLLTALQGRDLRLREVLKIASTQVEKKTGGQQVPYVNGPPSLDDFLLDGEPINMPLVESVTPMQPVSDPRADEIAAQMRAEEARLAELKKQQQRQSYEPEMVAIPAGCFMMGSSESEVERDSDEGPQHEVCVQALQVGKYEVTQNQWQSVMGNNPAYFKNCADCPVEKISWNDVQEYIRKLNRRTGKNYRLPTEAEWEYAARAGTTTPFWTGNCISTDQANYDGSYDYNNCGSKIGVYRKKPLPVGSFAANSFGLYDTAGNVWEWTCSVYVTPYDNNEFQCTKSDSSELVVLRGGSFYNTTRGMRAAFRAKKDTYYRADNLGFRVVK